MTWIIAALLPLGPLAASAGQVDGPSVGEAPLYEARGSAQGGHLRVWRFSRTEAEFEVRGRDLTVRRRVGPGRSMTEIVAADDHLRIEMSRDHVRLEDRDGVWRADAGDRQGAADVKGRIEQSAAFGGALDLLRRVARESTGPVAHLVLSTRNALAILRGERQATPRLAMLQRQHLARLRLVTAALRQMTPGECWDVYAAEAIEIYMEYEDCVDNEEWWDIIGLGSCATVYEMQALGAFSWWLNCTAIRG